VYHDREATVAPPYSAQERRRRREPPPPRRPSLNTFRLVKFARRLFNERGEPHWRELGAHDWRAFVLQRFRLTLAQKETLATLPDDVVTEIAGAVRRLVEGGGLLEAQLPDDRKSGRLQFSESRLVGDLPDARMMVPILDCTFDADCRNWRCRRR